MREPKMVICRRCKTEVVAGPDGEPAPHNVPGQAVPSARELGPSGLFVFERCLPRRRGGLL